MYNMIEKEVSGPTAEIKHKFDQRHVNGVVKKIDGADPQDKDMEVGDVLDQSANASGNGNRLLLVFLSQFYSCLNRRQTKKQFLFQNAIFMSFMSNTVYCIQCVYSILFCTRILYSHSI